MKNFLKLTFLFISLFLVSCAGDIKTEVVLSLTGGIPAAKYITFSIFAGIGFILHLLWDGNTRNPNSSRTPVQFSWRFLLHDNWKRFIVSIILLYISFRFSNEFIGKEINEFVSIGIGFSSDLISKLAKQKLSILQVGSDTQPPLDQTNQ